LLFGLEYNQSMSGEKNRYLEGGAAEPAAHLLEHRLPWLFLGLLGGVAASVVVSKFEYLLASDLRLAFFIPIIVYMSDAVGTQAETIYVRNVAIRKIKFAKYLLKETAVGFGLGIIFGFIIGAFASYWLKSFEVGLTVGATMFINLSLAPILAVTIPALIHNEHSDPALAAGPVATIIQDLISLLIYFLVAIWIIF